MEEASRPIRFLTSEQICDINQDMIAAFGGLLVSNPNLREGFGLDSIQAAIRYSVFGQDRYPTLIDKAAALAWYIITTHPFHDTNKRTGMEAAIELLELNGHITRFDPQNLVDTAIAVGEGRMSFQAFKEWIERNVDVPTSND